MIQIPLTPDKYQETMMKLLNGVPGVIGFEPPSVDSPGTLVTDQVLLRFTYDKTDLNVTVAEKHGLAKFASENTIKAHLTDLLTGV